MGVCACFEHASAKTAETQEEALLMMIITSDNIMM
jgi:hypothetical protein